MTDALNAMPKYESYKPSGLPAVPEIPSGWSTRRAKYLIDEVNNRTSSGEETLLSLSKYLGVIAKDQLADRSGQAASLIGYKIVEPNQLVINKMQAANGLMSVSKVNGITSPDYSIYSTDNKGLILSEYICHILKQPEFQEEINKRVTGVMDGFIRLYTDDLFEIPIILPPLSAQKAIVAFLDEKTAQIDQAIEIK